MRTEDTTSTSLTAKPADTGITCRTDPVADETWVEMTERLGARLDISATYDLTAVHTAAESKAILDLMRGMARRLDRSLTQSREADFVTIYAERVDATSPALVPDLVPLGIPEAVVPDTGTVVHRPPSESRLDALLKDW
jgi:hypothetical protein